VKGRSLSLAAEVLLLSIDPAGGGLLVKRRRRRRLRRAVNAAGATLSDALDELREAGLVRGSLGPFGGRLELVDRGPAGQRFRELKDAMHHHRLGHEHDKQLFVLLAWTGVLARRLNRSERRVAVLRLRKLGRSLADAPREGAVSSAAITALVFAGGGDSFDTGSLVDSSGLDSGGGGDGGDFGGGDFGGGGDSGSS